MLWPNQPFVTTALSRLTQEAHILKVTFSYEGSVHCVPSANREMLEITSVSKKRDWFDEWHMHNFNCMTIKHYTPEECIKLWENQYDLLLNGKGLQNSTFPILKKPHQFF